MKKHPETKQVNSRVEDKQLVATAGTVAKKRRPTLKSNTGSRYRRKREYQEFCKRLVFLNGAGMVSNFPLTTVLVRVQGRVGEVAKEIDYEFVDVQSRQVLDLDGNDRSLGRLGTLARRTNQGDETTWWDLQVALLDHYCTSKFLF